MDYDGFPEFSKSKNSSQKIALDDFHPSIQLSMSLSAVESRPATAPNVVLQGLHLGGAWGSEPKRSRGLIPIPSRGLGYLNLHLG